MINYHQFESSEFQNLCLNMFFVEKKDSLKGKNTAGLFDFNMLHVPLWICNFQRPATSAHSGVAPVLISISVPVANPVAGFTS